MSWLAAFRAQTDPQDKSDERGQKGLLSDSVPFVRETESRAPRPSAADYAYAHEALRRARAMFAPEILADEAELTLRGEPLP